ncbi:MAG: alpha/beta hydrolase [Bacteroidales bacterium]|nr:alpha/beta hydrolase [Bacteroidales bacterium]
MEFYAISQGIPVHISDTQKGDTALVLLHGYLETLYIFSEFEERLSPYVRIISLDLPGHGLTGTKEVNTMEFMADVVAGVLDKCNVDSAYFAGHSMGGYVAQEFIKRYPARSKGMILLNSTPFADDPQKLHDREREIELIKKGKLTAIAQLGIPKMYAPENLRRFGDKIEETVENVDAHDPAGIIASIKGLVSRADNSPFIKTLNDGLMIFGDKDSFIGKENYEKIISFNPNIKSVLLPNTGHNCFIEEEDKTVGLVLDFMHILP